MADAPRPITSPPALPWQPYDATAAGDSSYQSEPGTVYDSAGGSSQGHPWAKPAEGGYSPDFKAANGQWPDNGASDASRWKSC